MSVTRIELRLLPVLVLGLAAAPARAQETYLEGRPVSRIEVNGLGVTKEYVVRRELQTVAGAPLSARGIERDYSRLLNLGIFSKVQVDTLAEGDSVAVSYNLRELSWIIPYPRISYTVENGWSFGLGVASPNLMGRAMTLGVSATAGGSDMADAYFRHPWFADDHYSIELGGSRAVRQDELNDFEQTSTEGFVGLGTYIGEFGRGYLSGRYLEIQADQPGKTLSSTNADEMFIVTSTIGYDNRDRYEDPHRGWQNELLVSWTGGAGDQPANFWTIQFDARRYIPTGRQTKLLVGGLVSLRSGRVGDNIPEYLQYYLGGANTIRGYDLFELGPTLFGKNQSLITAEYQWTFLDMRDVTVLSVPLRFGLQAAAFADWGNAWSLGGDFNRERGRGSLGAGLRVLVPGIDMVRFDVGVAEGGEVLFAFGAGLKFDVQKERVR